MPEATQLLTFALICLGMVLTPGPNMIYLISRSICQGRKAGLISLGGVALGFVIYMFCAALGITALVMAVPLPTMHCALVARCICCTWPGKRCARVVAPRSRSRTCRRTARAGCLPWVLPPAC